MTRLSPLIHSLEEAVTNANPAECPSLIGELERIKALAWSKMVEAPSKTVAQANGGIYLTIPQVADRLAIPKTKAYELARAGHLPSVRIGKYVRVTEQALSDWLSRRGQ